MDVLRAKSLRLTRYLELLITSKLSRQVSIFTPSDPTQRGCQLSLSFVSDVDVIHARLQEMGVMCDVRKPNVMRIAPAPLYNSFTDLLEFVNILAKVLASF